MQEIRQLSAKELESKYSEMSREYYRWRQDVTLGKERNHAKLSGMRRDIARVKAAIRVSKVKKDEK